MNPWSHLPNAHHIDTVLAHLKAHPDKWGAAKGAAWNAALDAAWNAARGAARDAAKDAAWNAAWDTTRDTARGAAWNAARGAARGAAWNAARDALLALIAYDNCSHILSLPSGAVKLAALSGSQAAVLLLPAVIAMEER